MLAAGLLPDVVHVRVITSFSMAGLVNPVISGRLGTPVMHTNIITILDMVLYTSVFIYLNQIKCMCSSVRMQKNK